MWIIPAGLMTAAFLTAGCSPKPPPSSPASSASPGNPQATATPAATPTPVNQPIKAISRGSGNEPARYVVRNGKGEIQYDVRSTTVVYDRAADGTAIATFSKPHVIFHDRTGRTMIADAPEAVAHDKDKSVTMSGGVHAKTDDGKTLVCQTLTYDAKRDRLQGTGNVLLTNTTTNQSATGSQLTSDLSFEHLILSGNP
jgi:LPS export ABC transporter protein LptC